MLISFFEVGAAKQQVDRMRHAVVGALVLIARMPNSFDVNLLWFELQTHVFELVMKDAL